MTTSAFSKNTMFPFIGGIIDEALQTNASINRDEIAQRLQRSRATRRYVTQASKKYPANDIAKASGNMVDWFSAELTKQSVAATPWINKYVRSRVPVKGSKGTRQIWAYSLAEGTSVDQIPEDLVTSFPEGATKQITVNAYERSAKAKEQCKKIYGLVCVCCGFDFLEKYGDIGAEFIHVHHLTPLSEIKKEYQVDPEKDLRPVCPNCHAMIHRRNPYFAITEIQELIRQKALADLRKGHK
jgi:hypothetical protein